MTKIDFLDAVGRVDMKYIEECVTYKPPKRINAWTKHLGTLAACFVAVIAVIFIINNTKAPDIINENGFYIENGVLLSYTGDATDITIPETVSSIADFAFMNNENAAKITVVRLGESVTNVDVNALAGLSGLVDLVISENNLSFVYENGLVMTNDGSVLLKYERAGETSFTIPDSVRYVAAHAVQNTSLEEIDFGDKLEYIGYAAFAGNYNLEAIYLPESLTYISEVAFAGCASAVDGYIPESAEYFDSSFESVPFYNSMLAGEMCPGEEIERGLVTPSEAILKSDTYSLTEQINYVLACMRGDSDYVPSEAAKFAYASATGVPEVPDDMEVPESFTIEDLYFDDRGWGKTGIYDLQIFLDAGKYTIVMEAYGYGLYDELYWKESRFRLAGVYYIKNPNDYAPEETVKDKGWTAVINKEDGLYANVTFIHEDGTVVHNNTHYHSTEPFKITFSPNGTRAAIEYLHAYGYRSFLIVALNGEGLGVSGGWNYNEYLSNHNGQYIGNSLKWIDEDNLAGENEHGSFVYNVYEFEVEQEKRADKIDIITPFATLDMHEDSKKDGAYRSFTLKALDSGKEVTFEGMSLEYREPSLEKAQINSDKVDDIVVIMTDGTGTGAHSENVHIFDGRTLEEIPYKSAKNIIAEQVKIENSDIGYDVKTPTAKYSVIRKEGDFEHTADLPGVGHIFYHFISEGKLYCRAVLMISPSETVAELIVSYKYASGELVTDDIYYVHNQTEYYYLSDITIDKKDFFELYNNYSSLPFHPFTIKVGGFSTPVSIGMNYQSNMNSITAFGRTLYVNESVHFAPTFHTALFEHNGSIVFSWDNYGVGYTYILGQNAAEEFEIGQYTSIKLYFDDAGALRYRRSNNAMASIVQTGALSVARGYDDLLYETGPAYLKDGVLTLGEPDESYTLSDKYDLDREFLTLGYDREYSTIEEIFEENKKLPYGPPSKILYGKLLTSTAAKLKILYGDMTYLYSEHGPGQPVYSLKNLWGFQLVFHGLDSASPLPDDAIPDEICTTGGYGNDFFGLRMGLDMSTWSAFEWDSAEFSEMNGTVTLTKETADFIITISVYDDDLPNETTELEAFKKEPRGIISEIRVKLNPNKN